MKNLNYVTVLVLGLFFISMSAQASGTRTEFNSYEITTVNELHMGKKVQAIWTVSYSKAEEPVTIVKRKTFEGVEYVVQNKYFAVSYLSTVNGFGAKEVRKSWSGVHKKLNEAVINKEELSKQKLITTNKVNDDYAIGLIASFLPELINDDYTHILN